MADDYGVLDTEHYYDMKIIVGSLSRLKRDDAEFSNSSVTYEIKSAFVHPYAC